MKFPKLPDGPHPVGEAKVRFMKTLDAPYLSASAPGWSAHKTGEFSRVEVTPDPQPQTESVTLGDGWYSFSEGLRNPGSTAEKFVRIRRARRLKLGFSETGLVPEEGVDGGANYGDWIRKTVGIFAGTKGELWFVQRGEYNEDDETYPIELLRSARGEDPSLVMTLTTTAYVAGGARGMGGSVMEFYEELSPPFPSVFRFKHGRTSLLITHHNGITPLSHDGNSYSACAPALWAMRYREGVLEGYEIEGLPTEGGKCHILSDLVLLGLGRVGALIFSYTAAEAFSLGDLVCVPKLYEISENEDGVLAVRRELELSPVYDNHVPRPEAGYGTYQWIDRASSYLAYNTSVLPLTETRTLVLNRVITDWGSTNLDDRRPIVSRLQHCVFNIKTGTVESTENVTEFFRQNRPGYPPNWAPSFSGGVVVVGHGSWLRYNSFNKVAELVTEFGANKRSVTAEIGMVSPVVVGTRRQDGSGYVVYFIRSYTVDWWSELFDEAGNAGTGYEDSDPRSMLREVWVAKEDMTVFEKVCDIVEDASFSKYDYTYLIHAGTRLVPGHTLGAMPWVYDNKIPAPSWFMDAET